MESLQWNEVLATGIEEIDDQHKRLLEIINQLRVAAGQGARRDASAEALQQVLDYTIYHFDYEEKLLEKAGYELLPLHKRTHELFIRRIPDFQKRHAAGEDVLQEVHDMLARWLVHHIQNDDRGYAPTVKAYLKQDAKKSPSRYGQTRPQPLAEDPPASAPAGKRGAKRSFWNKLADLFSSDD